MFSRDSAASRTCELRPVIGLTRGLEINDIETLAKKAIGVHRQLVERADQLFQAMPSAYRTGQATGGEQHLEYIEAMIEMHAQMNAVNTLVDILGYVPSV